MVTHGSAHGSKGAGDTTQGSSVTGGNARNHAHCNTVAESMHFWSMATDAKVCLPFGYRVTKVLANGNVVSLFLSPPEVPGSIPRTVRRCEQGAGNNRNMKSSTENSKNINQKNVNMLVGSKVCAPKRQMVNALLMSSTI